MVSALVSANPTSQVAPKTIAVPLCGASRGAGPSRAEQAAAPDHVAAVFLQASGKTFYIRIYVPVFYY